MPNLIPVQWSETFVEWFERFARPARYLYVRVLWRWINQYGRKGVSQNNKNLITKRIRKAPYLVQYTKIGKVLKRFPRPAFTDLDNWQFVLKYSGHLLSSWTCLQSRKKHWPRRVKISCQKISANRKSPEGWPLTFWPKVRHVAPSFHLPLEYEVRSLYIEKINSYCTRNNGLFMRHNYLDLQTGDLKLYVRLPVVL